ncbi:MAG TPA: ABC transporter permease [Actinomycetes bacterium]|nr:ABC transporter permease [Actinomycetes bacterium]
MFLRGRPYEVIRSVRGALGELWSDKAGLFGVGVLVLLVLTAVFAPLLAPHDPAAQSLQNRLRPPFWYPEGSLENPLGADGLGRDILSRMIYGSRVSLIVGASVVLMAGTFGTLMGLIAGYRGGRTDSIIMRVVDTQVAFPGLLLVLIILAAIGPSMTTIIVVLALNGWMVYARITRGVVLSVKEMPYVEAAEIVGCPSKRVVLRHILPNLASPLLTLAVLEFARIILAEAALSFLGVGIQPPQVSWGLMVAQGRDYLFNGWWIITWPGLAIALTVLGINLFASWLRVTADPQEREKRFARSATEMRQGSVT